MTDQDPQPSPEILYPHWQREYEAALLEPESEALRELIKDAEAAISRRLLELAHDSDHHTERQVIDDALASLRVLRQNFGFSEAV
jgi:hypothetical protein